MSSGPITPFPIRGPIMEQDGQTVSSIPARWFNTVQQYLNSLLGPTAATGPLNPTVVVAWRKITIGGVTYYTALYQ